MLYIFDLDGTLAHSKNAKPLTGKSFGESIYYNRVGAVRRLSKRNAIAIATNQAGVSLGYVTLGDVLLKLSALSVLVNADAFAAALWHPSVAYTRQMQYALNHPEHGFSLDPQWRKPMPGMLHFLAKKLGYDLKETVYIGDRIEDKLAAENGGTNYIDADAFFALTFNQPHP